MTKARANPSYDDGYLGYALSQAAHVWRTQLGKELADLNITPPQFFVIASLFYLSIRRVVQPTQKQLAERVAMDVNTASQVIRSLEKRGLIVRSPHSEDKRAVALSLSPSGEALALKSTKRARETNERFFSESEQEGLYEELRRLIAKNKSNEEYKDESNSNTDVSAKRSV